VATGIGQSRFFSTAFVVRLSEPTVIVMPELIVGNAISVSVGLLEKTTDPAPLLSVVSVLTMTPPSRSNTN
jgi:hypothetical protein